MLIRNFIFFFIYLSLFIITFSKTSFPEIQRKFYFGGKFTEVYYYNTTSLNVEKKNINNIASFDGVTGIWQSVGKKGTDGTVNEIHVDSVRKKKKFTIKKVFKCVYRR